ncbi:GbsR/MarR family transcriptional regulator [Fulvivirga sedimenti]|uniref:HTH-type transcriptional regulator n=1 Tax=Fulvivirga sedimenti TaxID=2879465 RepID=A0A9X1HSW4_9BACT|nr:transcriptional regulator [Fulvivirga sedimenti]MCA6075577.1 transcriptional regulator [Fulvivirga sedimenti]MCA6076754.1 transcriptional regulator [Fulvivirga sedimenti]MCA6077882.1 transcriptional regulator [Fulvivirga sedimenti]
MDYSAAKDEFIRAWGTLGTSWGINRTMAQIFALLLISPEPISVDEIMGELKVSRGNASMNLRALMDWGLAQKTSKKGDRKEFYYTDRDTWALARKVVAVRRNREIEPILNVLRDVQQVEPGDDANISEFKRVTSELTEVVRTTDQALNLFMESDKSWILKNLLQILKSRGRQK